MAKSFVQRLTDAQWNSREHQPFEYWMGGIVLDCGCTKIEHVNGATQWQVGDVKPRARYEGGCQRRFFKHKGPQRHQDMLREVIRG